MPRRPPADWTAFVNEPHDLEELAALRDAVNRGSPFGDDDRSHGPRSGPEKQPPPERTSEEGHC
jgi:hypothetical protein